MKRMKVRGSGFTCTTYNFAAKVMDETSGVKEASVKIISPGSSFILNVSKENEIYSGNFSDLQPAVYSLEIKVEDNAGNIASEIISFNVTSYVLDWLAPLNLSRSFNLGSTIPIKFTLRDKLDGSFIVDYSVRVEVFNPNSMLVFNATYGTGDDSVRINTTEQSYIANVHTSRTWAIGDYILRVSFGNDPCDIFQKIVTIESKGGGRKWERN